MEENIKAKIVMEQVCYAIINVMKELSGIRKNLRRWTASIKLWL